MTRDQPPTEARHPGTADVDTLDAQAIVRTILAEDARAVAAAMEAAPAVALVVDAALPRLQRGGRVHYFGAGASGRLAMLDATEITPTFGVEPGTFSVHFAGGTAAVVDPTIDLEDAADQGAADAAVVLDASSVAVGISASGSTAYVVGALMRAREMGALTVLITCDPSAALRDVVDLSIVADTGPEVLAGSTRLKAGTATKVILNAFSTALMMRMGRTFAGLMLGVRATNDKLRARVIRMLMDASSRPRDVCEQALVDADGVAPVALLVLLAGCPVDEAREALELAGSVRAALAMLGGVQT